MLVKPPNKEFPFRKSNLSQINILKELNDMFGTDLGR